jgi:hypothetical protein
MIYIWMDEYFYKSTRRSRDYNKSGGMDVDVDDDDDDDDGGDDDEDDASSSKDPRRCRIDALCEFSLWIPSRGEVLRVFGVSMCWI